MDTTDASGGAALSPTSTAGVTLHPSSSASPRDLLATATGAPPVGGGAVDALFPMRASGGAPVAVVASPPSQRRTGGGLVKPISTTTASADPWSVLSVQTAVKDLRIETAEEKKKREREEKEKQESSFEAPTGWVTF
eukprot:TRINITY_DN278_c3_g1_i1.p2 TRINITY_DN278_c3_g1~~TRINITY_DN278_c3_g1_i1.p2  ORF type:complete len:137 (-),score=33.10 TRINITY_DN278_c3_g1_i1:202-612(-)